MKSRQVAINAALFRRTSPVAPSTIQWLVPSLSDKFSVVTTSVGDFKAPNPCEFQRELLTSRRGRRLNTDRISGDWIEELEGNFGCDVPLPSGTLSGAVSPALYNRVVADLYDQLRGGLDLSVDLAQSGEVVGMLRSAKAAVDYVRKFRPSDLRRWYGSYLLGRNRLAGDKISNGMKSAGSKWLEFQYGLKPFCQSVYDTSQMLQNHVSAPIRIRARGTDVDEGVKTYSLDAQTSVKGTVKTKRSERLEIVAHFAPEPSALMFLSGFSSLNPASIAWELTPYSFVVDWFIDVGGYMRSLETAVLYASSFRGGYQTESILAESTLLPVYQTVSDSSSTWFYSMRDGSSRSTWKKRSVLERAPIPKPPVLKAQLGATRLLNAAGLLSQHLGLKPSERNPALTPNRGGNIPKFR